MVQFHGKTQVGKVVECFMLPVLEIPKLCYKDSFETTVMPVNNAVIDVVDAVVTALQCFNI
jgi:hypothetical protein